MITGVAEGYYAGVLSRNPHLRGKAVTAAMPYGGEEEDHRQADRLDLTPYLFADDQDAFRLVYAGAMLPRAYEPLERVFRAIAANQTLFRDVRFYFIGTGRAPDDKEGYNVRPLAEQFGLWNTIVKEFPARIPYLDVLAHLKNADAAFVLGSTEAHYTPSKVYQAVLSRTPVLSVLHEQSTAAEVVRRTGAGRVLTFNGAGDTDRIQSDFASVFSEFRSFAARFSESQIDLEAFSQYSARASAATLAAALSKSLERQDERLRSS